MLKLVTIPIHTWGSDTPPKPSPGCSIARAGPGACGWPGWPKEGCATSTAPAKNVNKAPSWCLQGLADKKRANSCLPGKRPSWVWVSGPGTHTQGSCLRAWPWLRWHHRGKHHPAPHRQCHRSPVFGIQWKMALFHLLARSAKLLPDAAIKSRLLWSFHFIFLYLQRKITAILTCSPIAPDHQS